MSSTPFGLNAKSPVRAMTCSISVTLPPSDFRRTARSTWDAVPPFVSSTTAWVSVLHVPVSMIVRVNRALPPVLKKPSPFFTSAAFSVMRTVGAVGSADMSSVSTALK